MRKYDLGEIILERTFECRAVDGTLSHIHLRVGQPQVHAEASSASDFTVWYCHHQIVGIGTEKVQAARGGDAIDALLVSLQMADAILKFYARVYQKKVTWFDQENLGLPSMPETDENRPDDDFFDRIFQQNR